MRTLIQLTWRLNVTRKKNIFSNILTYLLKFFRLCTELHSEWFKLEGYSFCSKSKPHQLWTDFLSYHSKMHYMETGKIKRIKTPLSFASFFQSQPGNTSVYLHRNINFLMKILLYQALNNAWVGNDRVKNYSIKGYF